VRFLEVEASDPATTEESARELHHDPDYKWMSVDGKRYPFEGEFTPEQASVLRHLHERYQKGDRDPTYAMVRDSLGRTTLYLDDLFRSRKGTWGKNGLLGSGSRRGTVVLNI